jgi:hypothetical protein
MSDVSNADKNLVGAAGEHLVLSRLLTRGILAAQAPRGTRKADILVNHLDGKPPCLVQVKTRSGKGGEGWAMNEKSEHHLEDDLFYCFVDIEPEHPRVFVMPAKKVAEFLKDSHSAWLLTPGKKGQMHNETPMRVMTNKPNPVTENTPRGWMDEYLEKWELLTN